MKESHVELIDPHEKLSPSIGGTGYVGPKQPATAAALRADAVNSKERWPDLNRTVWKVLRSSVNWKWNRPAKSRRLKIEGRVVSCEILGGVIDWWFVAVDATKAAKILE